MADRQSIPVALLSLATAVPETLVSQDIVTQFARKMFSRHPGLFDGMAGVFQNTGIATRHVVRPPEWYEGEHGWKARNQVYLESADALYVEAATKALERAGVRAEEVDTLVTVSTTGIATPSLEARVAGQMGFRQDVDRVPVFGLGCAGGVSGLSIASRLASAGAERTVLLVAIELCSISIRLDQPSKASVVATALFGDGAAACVLRSGTGGIAAIGGGAQILWPDTLDIMGWNVEDPGLGVVFDRAIPPFVEQHMAQAVARIAESNGISRADIHRFTCHPGGAKVITALESSLELEEGTLDHERIVLRDYGNMSAPTVLFVLERVLEAGMPDNTMLLALGPGFTASGLMLTKPQ